MKSIDYWKGYEDAKELILKIIYRDYIKYCEQQNGISACKNCGISSNELRDKIVEHEQNHI